MAEPLKNMFSTDFVKNLAKELKNSDPNFNIPKFTKSVLDKNWEARELKDRTQYIAAQMVAFLPYPYKKQIEILIKVAPKFGGYTGTIFPTVVEYFGLSDVETSLYAIEKFTPYSTSEFAIRPFLNEHPQLINTLYKWSKSDNFHVRRLASEGCRPLLPWATKLHQYVNDPSAILPILETLRNDSEDYVYRSVANNLNDISKNHPQLVLELCSKWINESATTKWVVKHALRTLLKKGDQTAMKLFGFGSIKSIAITDFTIAEKSIQIGKATELNIEIKNSGKTALFRLEYAIGYLKKNGSHNKKVFQLKETELKNGQVLSFTKKLDFKELSTRKHHIGKHYIYLKVNGIVVKEDEFNLV